MKNVSYFIVLMFYMPFFYQAISNFTKDITLKYLWPQEGSLY